MKCRVALSRNILSALVKGRHLCDRAARPANLIEEVSFFILTSLIMFHSDEAGSSPPRFRHISAWLAAGALLCVGAMSRELT
jgi:hypothetical protein